MHTPGPIKEVAHKLGLAEEFLIPYGRDKAKVDLELLERPRARAQEARLILVSAITPTPAGEGKTTTSIGLAQGMRRLGAQACVALREPSLGPCMGMKGGGTGGGRSQLVPSEDINLHFTGDFHAVTSAHNLLAALLDNHLHHGNALGLDPRRILWKRVLDMNDRALRHAVIGLGGPGQGVPRESGFDITPASEVMAMLCLASSRQDLQRRIERTLVGFTYDRQPVTAQQLGASGAMMALLRDAWMPNLVQTSEGCPALVHGGPFANIAHGCNSVVATRAALHLADWVVTEAGFGFDLGAEKFFDIKCASAGLKTSAVVLVATARALKMHGGVPRDQLRSPDPEALRRGLPNLERHLESVAHFGQRPVVALNHFADDSQEEIEALRAFCQARGLPFAVSRHFAQGGEGSEELARVVMEQAQQGPATHKALYQPSQSVQEKIEAVARSIYGARGVIYTKEARRALRELHRLGYQQLPVCIAKTQSSLSDDPALRGRPEGFDITVRDIEINAGAGFLVVLTGDILRMPGLPRRPQAESIALEGDSITGLR